MFKNYWTFELTIKSITFIFNFFPKFLEEWVWVKSCDWKPLSCIKLIASAYHYKTWTVELVVGAKLFRHSSLTKGVWSRWSDCSPKKDWALGDIPNSILQFFLKISKIFHFSWISTFRYCKNTSFFSTIPISQYLTSEACR